MVDSPIGGGRSRGLESLVVIAKSIVAGRQAGRQARAHTHTEAAAEGLHPDTKVEAGRANLEGDAFLKLPSP